jgi:PAS domain S-box-containing protein
VVEKRLSFLEAELENALAAREAPGSSNVVDFDQTPEGLARERERRFRDLLDALPAAVYTTDASGRLTYYNPAAAGLWGYRPELGTQDWCGSWKLYWPDGTPLPHGECPMAMTLKERKPLRGLEAIAERPDGSRVPVVPYPTPLFDAHGRLIGAVNMLVDISERKRAEADQHMLMREVHHRVRNTLAIAQAIVGSTAKSADTVEGFKDALIGRIAALARTHLLMSDGARVVAFDAMLHSELDPFDDASGERVVMNGPAIEIPTRHAVPLGIALHELTTNSSKHGALSALAGRVDATWRILIEADQRRLELDWIETGGPEAVKPAREGFGLQLLNSVLPRQINAETELLWLPEGLRVRIRIPLPADSGVPAKT